MHAVGGGEALNSYHYVSGNLLQARDPIGLWQESGLDGSPFRPFAAEEAAQRVRLSLPRTDPSLPLAGYGADHLGVSHGFRDSEGAWHERMPPPAVFQRFPRTPRSPSLDERAGVTP